MFVFQGFRVPRVLIEFGVLSCFRVPREFEAVRAFTVDPYSVQEG